MEGQGLVEGGPLLSQKKLNAQNDKGSWTSCTVCICRLQIKPVNVRYRPSNEFNRSLKVNIKCIFNEKCIMGLDLRIQWELTAL